MSEHTNPLPERDPAAKSGEAKTGPSNNERWATAQKEIGAYLREAVAAGHFSPEDDGAAYVTFDTPDYGPVVVSDYFSNMHPAARNSEDKSETMGFLAEDGKSTLSFQFRRPGDTIDSQLIATKVGDFDPDFGIMASNLVEAAGDKQEGEMVAVEILGEGKMAAVDVYSHPIYPDMIKEIVAQTQGASEKRPRPGRQ